MLCRSKMWMPEIQLDDIETAHLLQVRSGVSNTTTASAQTSTTKPSIIVRFRNRAARDGVMRQCRTLNGTRVSIVKDLTALNTPKP